MKLMVTLLVAIASLTSLLIWQISKSSAVYYNDRCFANVTYVDASDNSFLFNGNVTFEFSKNKNGIFNISGNIDYKGSRYHLSRYVAFTYNNINGNQYRMITSTKDVLAHDSLPENILPLATKIFGLNGEYTIYLNKKDNNFITIANTLAPLMNCVIQ